MEGQTISRRLFNPRAAREVGHAALVLARKLNNSVM